MKNAKTQEISIAIPMTMLGSNWKGNFENLPANQTYELIIDYPFGGERVHRFQIQTGQNGLGLVALLGKIGTSYEEIYKNPDENGVFGHDIDDLSLSGIKVDFVKKTIRLDVDS